jgi:hypothetical protein
VHTYTSTECIVDLPEFVDDPLWVEPPDHLPMVRHEPQRCVQCDAARLLSPFPAHALSTKWRNCDIPPWPGRSILAAQTSTSIGAETAIKTITAVHIQCPLWRGAALGDARKMQPASGSHGRPPQSNIELMTEKQILGFKPTPRADCKGPSRPCLRPGARSGLDRLIIRPEAWRHYRS